MQPLEAKLKEGLWRDGSLLVVARGAKFPPRCLKTNLPVDKQEFELTTFHYPPSFRVLTILCPPFVMVSELIGKEVTMLAPVGAGWRERRALTRLFLFSLYLLAIVSGVGMCLIGGELPWLVLLPGVCIGSIVLAMVVGLFFIPRVDLVAMSESYYWFRGCSKELLAEYPEFPPEANLYR